MPLAPGVRLGVYEVLGLIGSGGMGEVYRARDTRLDRTVAIKVLPDHVASDPAFRERFDRQARAVAALNHPNMLPAVAARTRKIRGNDGFGDACSGRAVR